MEFRPLYNTAVLAFPASACAAVGEAGEDEWRFLFAVLRGLPLPFEQEIIEKCAVFWARYGVIEVRADADRAMHEDDYIYKTDSQPSSAANNSDAIGVGRTNGADTGSGVGRTNGADTGSGDGRTNGADTGFGDGKANGADANGDGEKYKADVRQNPIYTAAELETFFKKNKGTADFLRALEKITHRVFNVAENNVIISLREYRGLEENYILLLAGFLENEVFNRTGKHLTVYTLGQRADRLAEDGIDTYALLEEYLARAERIFSFEGRVRSVFGIGTRKLTSGEEKILGTWVDYGISEELMSRAYELTVNATAKPSLAYANKILNRWHDEGFTTVEDVENERRKQGKGVENAESSFDTDDFFEAALKRSYAKK